MSLESYKKTVEKADMFDNIIGELNNYDKHIKGYIFDSLVYRYKLALEETVQSKTDLYVFNHCCNRKEAEVQVRKINNRDLQRFIQILDEAIGAHD
jgi:hypothetical protein